MVIRGNILGDIRAEHDAKMLDMAFWESSDYKSLLESHDRTIVVGRRGTGKSALAYRLAKYWSNKPNTHIIKIAPEEEQVIGLRDVFELFGENYTHIKAGAKLAWRYAIYMEIIVDIANHYKYKNNLDVSSIKNHLQSWGGKRISIATKIRRKLKDIMSLDETPQSRIADLSDKLELELLEEVINEAVEASSVKYVVLADKLDEGYSPDNLGVAIIDGFVQSVIDIKPRFNEKIVAYAFIRDNIYRAISMLDPDFTRNIEGQTWRLHWDEYSLFNLVCNRMRVAFNLDIENNTRVWNKLAVRDLNGQDGFRKALRLTLYRPRDIIVLLNDAFLNAFSHERREIVYDDIDVTAKVISINRINDLIKEYESIFPALEEFIKSFYEKAAEMSLDKAIDIVSTVLGKQELSRKEMQDLSFFDNGTQVLQRLYSVGFIGIYNPQTSSFVFCHDGKSPDKEFETSTKVMIHPCYRLALCLKAADFTQEDLEHIHDEYDIVVSSVSKDQRNTKIAELLAEIATIPEGTQGANDFEQWCFKALKIVFAGVVDNLELHPNKNGLQQRDVVGTNRAEVSFWKRVMTDYKSRQVVFEVKNFKDLGASEYRQVNSYLCNEYGNFAFIINRDFDNNLSRERELKWVKELYDNHKKVVVKISFKFLEKYLRKARNPQKHDAVDRELNNLLDTYHRSYFTNKCR